LTALLAAGLLVPAVLTACAQPTDPGAPNTPTEDAVSPTEDTPTPIEPSMPAPDWSGVELAPGVVVRGLPDGVEGTQDSPVGAAWSPAEGLLYVITYGSSSCPTTTEPEAADDGGTVVVTLVPPPADAICTMDYAPTTSVVGVPDGADSGEAVSVRLGDVGTVEVAPRPAPDEPGPAAWVPAK
jgi:hypothetical protein